MKTIQTSLLLLLSIFANVKVHAQTSNFEDISLAPNSYKNGSDFSGGFNSGSAFFTNNFDTTFGEYWEGFAISNLKDDSTKGYTNQYSSITGGGASSANYALLYSNGKIRLNATVAKNPISGFYLTNSTYAYYDMKEGSSFSKKFGGTSGNDSDYFRVVISAWKNGGNPADTSLQVYLADFRFKDNSKDYILKNWQWVDLTSFGKVDSFAFYFESSDTGSFGINTPQYLCLDHFNGVPTGNPEYAPTNFSFYPNPATSQITLVSDEHIEKIVVMDIKGNTLFSQSEKNIDVSMLSPGIYLLLVSDDKGTSVSKFIKE